MSTGINIYAASSGFDSRLFFPGSLGVSIVTAQITGSGFPTIYTEGELSYKLNGVSYRVTFEGTDFGLNAFQDFHGEVLSGKVDKLVNGSYQPIASMVFFPDPDNPYDAGFINSAASLTPDTLYSQNSYYNGAHLNFIGAAGADKLFGSRFGDYFIGVDGRDQMTGYGGADEFNFDRIGKANADHITDFRIGQDTILIDRSDDPSQFKGVTAANLDKTFHDITKQAEQSDDRIIYDRHTGNLSYDADGSGHKAAVVFAYLDNHAALDWRDFEMF